MARRKAVPVGPVDAVVPAWLQRCWVEDWLDPLTYEPAPYELGQLDDPSEWLIKAWCLWNRARHDWLASHEVPRDIACVIAPTSRPYFRNAPVFVAALSNVYPPRSSRGVG